jgi:hypothetical protein
VRGIDLIVAILVLCRTASWAADTRQFDIATLERLGNELSYRDHIASHTSDLILSQHPELKKVWLQSWISELHKDRDVIYWCAQTERGLVPEYKVTYPKAGGVHVDNIQGQKLPEGIVARFRARDTAMKASTGKLNVAYAARYNFELLDDPDGSGFLVYALAATNKIGEQLFGGHLRISVSADGNKAERIDKLSKGILQAHPPGREKELDLIAFYDPSGNIPPETYIYSSKLYNLPLFLAMKDGSRWEIWNGRMHKYTKAELAELEKEDQQKKKK